MRSYKVSRSEEKSRECVVLSRRRIVHRQEEMLDAWLPEMWPLEDLSTMLSFPSDCSARHS